MVGLPAHSISYYEPGPKFATCSALSPSQNMGVFGVGRDLKVPEKKLFLFVIKFLSQF